MLLLNLYINNDFNQGDKMIPNTAVRSSRSLKLITIATMFAYAAMSAMSAQAADGVAYAGDSLLDGVTTPRLADSASPPIRARRRRSTSPRIWALPPRRPIKAAATMRKGAQRSIQNFIVHSARIAQRPISAQVTEFLSANAGQASNKIILIQGGANDAFQNLAMYSGGYISQAQLGRSLCSSNRWWWILSRRWRSYRTYRKYIVKKYA